MVKRSEDSIVQELKKTNEFLGKILDVLLERLPLDEIERIVQDARRIERQKSRRTFKLPPKRSG